MLKFNAKEFLSLPVNDGEDYLDYKGCGCSKGNFARTVGLDKLIQEINYNLEKAFPNNSIVGYEPLQKARCIIGDILGAHNKTPKINPLLQKVLDRAEKIHRNEFDLKIVQYTDNDVPVYEKIIHKQGRPQYAKLFLIRALRRFKLVEFVEEEELITTNNEIRLINV